MITETAQKRPLATLTPYFKRYRLQYLLGFLCLIIVDGAQMLIPQYIKKAINIIAEGNFLFKDVLVISILMTATMLLIASGRFLWRYFIHGSSRRIETLLREKIFSHLLKLSGDFYQRNKIGDLMARTSNDVGAVRMAVGWGLVGFVDGTIMALAILIIIFIQAGKTAALAVLPLPAVIILIILLGKMIGPRFIRVQAAYSALSEAAQETFAGSRVIKSFVKESFFARAFSRLNDDYRTANMSLVKVHGFFFPLVAMLSGLTTLIVIFAGGRRVILGLMTPGDFVALFSYIQMLIWPVYGAGFTVNMIQRGLASLGRINEILNTEPSIQNEVDHIKAGWNNPAKPVIEVKHLSFTYPRAEDAAAKEGGGVEVPVKAALRDVSFSLPAGAWLGILGRTGSGKSTLVKILTRLIDAPRGSVFIYGVDIRAIPLDALRSVFGVSPQDSFLFSGSIAGNIRYGLSARAAAAGVFRAGAEDAGAEDALVQRMIDLSALRADLSAFAAGEDTIIGERGVTLSGGQKQRLSIARAAILQSEALILDDSLSAVDAETERRILSKLAQERAGKTTIIVSHRVSAFRNADYVAVLENGTISEFGPPKELLKADKYYAKTARLQMAAFHD